MSITGVPSMASIGPMRSRFPCIARTTTGCRPSGFGLSGDRVANTPVSRRRGSDRGCTCRTLRRARCSQVTMMSSSPTLSRCSPFRAHRRTSSHASGAPSEPCLGAPVLTLIVERITPTGRTREQIDLFRRAVLPISSFRCTGFRAFRASNANPPGSRPPRAEWPQNDSHCLIKFVSDINSHRARNASLR